MNNGRGELVVLRLDLGNACVLATVTLRPHEIPGRARRIAALINTAYPAAHAFQENEGYFEFELELQEKRLREKEMSHERG